MSQYEFCQKERVKKEIGVKEKVKKGKVKKGKVNQEKIKQENVKQEKVKIESHPENDSIALDETNTENIVIIAHNGEAVPVKDKSRYDTKEITTETIFEQKQRTINSSKFNKNINFKEKVSAMKLGKKKRQTK